MASDLGLKRVPPIFVPGIKHKDSSRSMVQFGSRTDTDTLIKTEFKQDLMVETRVRSSSLGSAGDAKKVGVGAGPLRPISRRLLEEGKISPRKTEPSSQQPPQLINPRALPALPTKGPVERYIKIFELPQEEKVVITTYGPTKLKPSLRKNSAQNNSGNFSISGNQPNTSSNTNNNSSNTGNSNINTAIVNTHIKIAGGNRNTTASPNRGGANAKANSPGTEVRKMEALKRPTKAAIALPPIVPPSRTESLCEKLIAELVESEHNYIQDLEVLQFTRDGIIQNVGELSSVELEAIFRNLDEVVALAKQIYEQLQRKPLTHIQLFKVFADIIPVFVATYTTYCSRHQQASDTIKELYQQRDEFKSFLKRLNTKLSFDAYVLKPMQHLCKYLMLMKEMREVITSVAQQNIKVVGKKDTEVVDNIASVIQNLEMLTKLVDERQYESVMEQRYILLQRELEAAGSNLLLISPSRRLIRNGPMMGQEQKQKSKSGGYDGFYYLFSDVFVFAKMRKNGGLKVVALIELLDCIALEGEHAFLLLFNKGKWRFVAHTYEEKLMCMVETKEAIERINYEDEMSRIRTEPTSSSVIARRGSASKRLSFWDRVFTRKQRLLL